MLIGVKDISVTIDDNAIVDNVSFDVGERQRWAIIGRNGAGKSTLVRAMARLQPVSHGDITVDGRNIREIGPRELATLIAYVPQAQGRIIPYRVRDYVLMGRFAYQGLFALPGREDRRSAQAALDMTDTAHLAERTMDTLSGGELQRVLLAGAVSQHARVLLLDEPTTYLDPLHCRSIQRALRRVHEEAGASLVTITHDVNSALTEYTHVLALVDGGAYFRGTIAELRERAEELLREVYGMPFEIVRTPGGARTFVVPSEAA
jgi:ABC-type cobalamin/Fe3+-siderophores transport system ATPase subunit